MSQQTSYQINSVSGDVKVEINRLKAQIELFWNKELKHYIEFGLSDGMSLVELGSGPGFATEKLLLAFPNLKITAVEIDSLLINYAKDYLSQKHLEQCEIIQNSIMKTGLADNSFDFAVTRLVLEHLPDPVNAVREIYRILKPGGKAVLVDNDFAIHIVTYPDVRLRELYDAYCESGYSKGGNPKIGRELPILLKAGGFTNIDFEIICAHSEIVGDEKFLKSEGIGIPSRLVSDGFLSSKVLGRISVDWRNMIKSESHCIMRQLYMAVGKKLV